MSGMMYGVEFHLIASTKGGAATAEGLLEHATLVMDQMALLEEADERMLDWSVSTDGENGHTCIEFTAEADNIDEAFSLAHTWARSAIHAAGGWTPDWDKGDPTEAMVGYELTTEGVNVRPLVDA